MHSARSKRKGSAEEAWKKAWTLSSAHRSKQKTRANEKKAGYLLRGFNVMLIF